MGERYKLVLGEKQLEIMISALSLLQSEDEVHYNNILGMTPDEQTASDLAHLRAEMRRAEELQKKLVKMRYYDNKVSA